MHLGSVLSSSIFWNSFRKLALNFFSKCLIEFACETVWFCWEVFNPSFNFGICVYFLFLPGSVLGDYTFLRIYPFIPECPFCWHTVACSSILQSFCWLKKMHNLRDANFLWGNRKTEAWEAAPQIVLRNCSKDAVGDHQYIRFWWRRSGYH